MRKAILLLTVAASLTMTAITSQAAIGWSLKNCERAFGKPIIGPKAALNGRKSYEFATPDFYINAFYSRKGIAYRLSQEDWVHRQSDYPHLTSIRRSQSDVGTCLPRSRRELALDKRREGFVCQFR
jgi:hypothetical protein